MSANGDDKGNVIDASAVFATGAACDGISVSAMPAEDVPNVAALADDDSKEPTIAEKIVELASDLELFHDDQVAYASVVNDGKRETWRVGAQGLKNFLARRFHLAVGKVPGDQPLRDALRVLEGRALYDGPEQKVHVRIARQGDVTYLDLADGDRHVVKMDARGWALVQDSPVRFVRPRGLMPLPVPVRGGWLDELRPFVNVKKLKTWRLVVAWLVSVFFAGPYCFLVLLGRQGSAKTSTSRHLRMVIDPNRSDVRAQPRSVQDLVIGASNSTFVVLDNISYIDDWLSDALCRMSTGGGFAARALYTDQDEIIMDVTRPGILNGIADVVARGDLLDRSILVELPPIPADERLPESEIRAAFDAAWPRILGALLDAVCGAMRHRPSVVLDELPRMADFALIGAAVEMALGWPEDSFIDAYQEAISSAHDVALEASVIAPLIKTLANENWQGTASELFTRLNDMFDGRWPRPSPLSSGPYRTKPRPKGWPGSPRGLSSQLKRLEPNLNAVGVTVTFTQTQGSGSRKIITIRSSTAQVPPPTAPPSVGPVAPAFVPLIPMAPVALPPAPARATPPPSTATPPPWQAPAPLFGFVPPRLDTACQTEDGEDE